VEVSRRSFLGGLVSLVALQAAPVRALGNLPTLWADGKHDDTGGLRALFNREPLVFATDKVQVDEFRSVIFHGGRFRITSTIELPEELDLKIESATFDLLDLPEELYALQGGNVRPFTGLFVRWVHWRGGFGPEPAKGVRNRQRFISSAEGQFEETV
jgi:hypothetical protein